MRYKHALVAMIFVTVLFSCRKEHDPNPTQPPTEPPTVPVPHVLLKDITIPHLPSPYYHFEYNLDSMVTKVEFASRFTSYDVIYNGNKISEMRNNIIVNHDTLRYIYDTGNKVVLIDFINEANVIYRHAYFTYQGNQVKEISWDHIDGNGNFSVDRTLSFAFYPDGNVKSINDQLPYQDGVPEHINITKFEGYDKEINVDDFSLIHDGIHDHLFLLQGFRLQKNNPTKEIFSADGLDLYTVDYTYVYNSNHTPSTKTGDFLYTSGQYEGKRFVTNSTYSYY